MIPPGVPNGQLPPPLVPIARVPTGVTVAAARDDQGPMIVLIVDTPTGRSHVHLEPDQAAQLVEAVTSAHRQVTTGLVIAQDAPGVPRGPSSPIGGRNGHAAPSGRYTPPRG